MSIIPSPLKVNDDVSRSSCLGKRKMSEQVFPESSAGMSKLKIVEMVSDTCPKYDVPLAWFGWDLSMGTIR